MGKVCVTLYNKYILTVKHAKNPTIHHIDELPEVSLALPKQVANPTSKSPAIIKSIQFMCQKYKKNLIRV
jgi:hypothetical protein